MEHVYAVVCLLDWSARQFPDYRFIDTMYMDEVQRHKINAKVRAAIVADMRKAIDRSPRPFLVEDGWRNPYSGDPLSPKPTYCTEPSLGKRMFVRQVWTVPELEAAEAATRDKMKRDARAAKRLAEVKIKASEDYSHYIPPHHPKPIPTHPHVDMPQFKQARAEWPQCMVIGNNDAEQLQQAFGDFSSDGFSGVAGKPVYAVRPRTTCLVPTVASLVLLLEDWTGLPIAELREVMHSRGHTPAQTAVRRKIADAIRSVVHIQGSEETLAEALQCNRKTIWRLRGHVPSQDNGAGDAKIPHVPSRDNSGA